MPKPHRFDTNVPTVCFELADGRNWFFRANQRAWYTLEAETKVPFSWYLANPDGRHTRDLMIAWAMTATHRRANGIVMEFEDWIDLLPAGDIYEKLMTSIINCVRDSFPKSEDDDSDEGEQKPAPSSPTPSGAGDSISSPESAV